MSGMMSNQPGMGGGGQHPSQHGMSSMNSMMGMGMGMNQGGNPPNNIGGGPGNPGMGGGMGHNPMHMGHQNQHLGQPPHGGGGQHHMMNTMNPMQHGGMNHPMNSMGSMPNMGVVAPNGMLGGMHPSNSMPGYPPTNNGLSYGNPMGPPSSNMSASGQSIAHIEWRAQFTRDQRASLIAKVYHEMVRVSTEPPGIALWINVAWFELTLFKECQTREDYINQIIKRLQQLKTQGGDMPSSQNGRHPGMPGGHLPNGGMQHPQQPHNPSGQYNMYNNPNAPNPLSINPSNGQIQHNPGHPTGFQSQQTSGQNSSAATPKQGKGSNNLNNKQQPPTSGNNGPAKSMSRSQSTGAMMPPQGGPSSQPSHPQHQQSPETLVNIQAGNNPAEYWRQHGMLKAKYLNDVSTVHSAFKKYVDHMKQDSESDQKQKLSFLLGYVQLCATVLDEDASTHPPRTLEELEKVNKYVVRIVLPYLKKLKTEKDRRSSGGSNTPQGGVPTNAPSNNPNSNNMGGGFEAMMGMRPGRGPTSQQQQHGPSMQQNQQSMQQQQNHFQSMMQAPVPKPPQQPSGGNMQQSSTGLILDDGGYNMGSGGPSSMHHSNANNPMYYGSNQPNMNSMGFMGNGYGGGMGGNDDMMSSLGQGSNDMNFLDMDGSSFAMGDATASGQGGGSSGEDGDGGDLMNIVEAL
ncbi:hypothetical protein DYB32_007259 [Aphanomyces invadans]|nr:hypothetical protein DYB32_007259 [Aphanomyces invadans]